MNQSNFEKIVTIKRLNKKGLGVGLCDDFSKEIELRAVYPGEKVKSLVRKKKKGSHCGDVLEILEASPARCEKKCTHFPLCGGCSWQTFDYKDQLAYKQRLIESLFPHQKAATIIGIDFPWEFRNKMEWSFYDKKEGFGTLGLIEAGSKGRVFDVTECYICPEWMVECLNKIRSWWQAHPEIRAYHILRKTGTLHTLTMREGRNTGEKMVILTVCGAPSEAFSHKELESFKEAVIEVCGHDVSIFLVIKHIETGVATYSNEMLLHGKDHILEKIYIQYLDQSKVLTFKISPASFFQPNTRQAEKIYSKALEMAGQEPLDVVLDLYSGTGTLGIAFSSLCKKVIAVEINPYATFDAAVNIETNQVKNMTVIQGDVKEVIEKKLIDKQVDLVIVDPPRSGLGEKVCNQVVAFNPNKILYISCNPYTQQEDTNRLVAMGYKIVSIQPIDQFAHSAHMENLMLLKRCEE